MMKVGDRIEAVRARKELTQQQLGIMIGFDEKSAAGRIAQYESGDEVPCEETKKDRCGSGYQLLLFL